MLTIVARNVHEAFPRALEALLQLGRHRDSRNGPVLKFPVPVCTQYLRPTERVIFHPVRDANPFFHLFESLWMLDGRRDVGFVAQFASRMNDYSDDGETLHGAYGYRWRHYFDKDQLEHVIAALKANPDDRRQVIQMWDARADLSSRGKDVPCNTQAYVQINDLGALELMVTNRSNDLVWGAYGANAVHFSVLLEYLAAAIGVPIGAYYQVSMNTHLYLGKYEHLLKWKDDGANPYADPYYTPVSLLAPDRPRAEWDLELTYFLREGPGTIDLRDPFLARVAAPMWLAWQSYKRKDYRSAFLYVDDCHAPDWRRAATEWLLRRKNA